MKRSGLFDVHVPQHRALKPVLPDRLAGEPIGKHHVWLGGVERRRPSEVGSARSLDREPVLRTSSVMRRFRGRGPFPAASDRGCSATGGAHSGAHLTVAIREVRLDGSHGRELLLDRIPALEASFRE